MRELFGLVGLLLTEIRKMRGVRRGAGAGDACIACGSTDVVVADGLRLCLTCNYEGRADGGGPLTREEVGSLYESEGGGLFR